MDRRFESSVHYSMVNIPLAIFIAAFLSALSARLFFEFLLKIEYEHFRKDWERDNRPFGVYWLVNPIPNFPDRKSFAASNKCFWKWLFSAPEWTLSMRTAQIYLLAFRLSFAGIFLFILLYLLLFGRFL